MQSRSKQHNQSAAAHRAFRGSNALRIGALFLLGAVYGLQGCGSGGVPPAYTGSNGGGGGPTTPSSSNNWQFALTATGFGSSPDPITALSGSIVTRNADADAVFQVTTKGCYSNSLVIPLLGTINGTSFTAQSFAVKNQFLNMTGTFNGDASTISGSYNIGGGCSNGEKGTFTGQRYASLTGTYKGTPATSTMPVTVTIMQSKSPTGEGSFLLTGSVAVAGSTCFASGTMQTSSYISGSSVNMSFNAATSSGGTAVLNGTVTPDAATITVPSAAFNACGGNLGALTLTRQ